MEWEVNAFIAMGITIAKKIKNKKKKYTVNKTQQNKIYVNAKQEINKSMKLMSANVTLKSIFEGVKKSH